MRFRMPQLSRRWRERINRWKEGSLRYVLLPWFALVNAFSWVGTTLAKAWGTRNLRCFIQGLPALTAYCGVIVLLVFAMLSRAQESKSNLAARYVVEGSTALRSRNFELARPYFEKALALDSTKDDPKFLLALTMEQLGQIDESVELMLELAPDKHNGYSPAHRWRGDYIATRFRASPDTLAAAERQYIRAHNSAVPDSDDRYAAAARLGQFLAAFGRTQEALPYTVEAAVKLPAQRLVLGDLYRKLQRDALTQKQDELAKKRGEQALQSYASAAAAFKSKAEDNVDDRDSRLLWAMALVGQEKFQEAIEALKTGATTSNDTTYFQAASSVFTAWEQSLAQKGGNFRDRFAKVQQGLEIFPANTQLLARLVAFSELKGEDGEQANKLISDMLASGKKVPWVIYFFLGLKAHAEKKDAEAIQNWEKALQLNPSMSVVANNLAWMLSRKNPPELDRALPMIEKAIERQPGVPQFYGTRGEIRAKMGRYQEALADLQQGLAASPNNPDLHESIALCYEKTGDAAKAKQHRDKAAEIRKKMERPPLQPGPGTAAPPGAPSDDKPASPAGPSHNKPGGDDKSKAAPPPA